MKSYTDQKIGEHVKADNDRKAPRKVGLDRTLSVICEGTVGQTSGDGERWRTGYYEMEEKYTDRIGGLQKTIHSWWKTGATYPVQKVGDCAKNICREHNQEASHMATLGTEGVLTVTVVTWRHRQREGQRQQCMRHRDKRQPTRETE